MNVSNVPQGPPSEGWYALGGNADDLAYFDGRAWTWRRWRLPSGEWRQEPITPPSAAAPDAMSSPPPPSGEHGAAPDPMPSSAVTSTDPGPAAGPTPLPPGGEQSWSPPPTPGVPSASERSDQEPPSIPAIPPPPAAVPPIDPAGRSGGAGITGTPPSGPGPADGGEPFHPGGPSVPGYWARPTSPGGPSAPTSPGGPTYLGGPSAPTSPGGPTYPSGAGGTWPGWPSPFSPSVRLDLHLSEPERQERWKTLIRLLLVLPNLVALAFFEIAAALVTILMWFAALFTARVPEWLWRFSKGVLQWAARTFAFVLFLTDAYPPFKEGDVPYPVSITLDRPDRFNRLAVLFRVVLVIPAAIVTTVYSYGVGILSIVVWFVTLVRGRCPRTLHLVFAAWLRYQLRYLAYYGLLTTEYPSAPLGDAQTRSGSLESGAIVLRGSAKALAVIAIVLGAVLYFVTSVSAIAATHTKAQTAIAQWNALQSRGAAAATRFATRAGGCGGTVHCVERATSILTRSLSTQVSTIEAITFPTVLTRSDASSIVAILEQERSVIVQAQGAGTPQTFDNDMKPLVSLTQQLQPDVVKLLRDLEAAP